MYNKIAQIILNSGKGVGASDVFVSQPDANQENLAGKIFILAEIGGKKSDGEKIISFLISELNEHYYNDEKLMLRGKIEGLKIENIFEAALAKINKNLIEFLNNQKIKINSSATSVTIGVIYENKLHFAGFGKNRSLLIYRRSDGYEIINVETSAENSVSSSEDQHLNTQRHDDGQKIAGLFSSVISGEVPLGSYFIFASESLPEYLSGREMVEIITKLPPIVAAEQIKNALLKMNTYVPFLGVIIKNTTDSGGQEIKEPVEEALTAHTSISSLNSTEQRTEKMLAPAGIISFKKISNLLSDLIKNWQNKARVKASQKAKRKTIISENTYSEPSPEKERTASLNLPSASSFLSPSKIKLKQSSSLLFHNVGKLVKASPALVHKSFWSGLVSGAISWVKNLNKKNRLLFTGLIVVALVLAISLTSSINKSRKQKAEAEFQALVTQIEEKGTMIDSYLLYNNEDGASKVLTDAVALIASLPQDTKEQQAQYQTLSANLKALENKVKKINQVDNLEKISDLVGLNVSGLVFADNKLYGTSGGSVQTIDFKADKVTATEIAVDANLSGGKYDGKNAIFYRNGAKIFKFDIKTAKVANYDIKDYNEADNYSGLNIFNANLYLAASAKNQIYKYSGANLATKSDWLKETIDLSKIVDLYIDGSIYALNSDGAITKLHLNKRADYAANRALDPATSSATKILGDANQLYVLDAANKRLAIIAKSDGHLMNQYVFPSLPSLNDFALDDGGKVIYLLSGESIYKLAL
ncbi:MAG: PP2C family serine/threonine-protein phosphatase [Patescibacteria group bacterium]